LVPEAVLNLASDSLKLGPDSMEVSLLAFVWMVKDCWWFGEAWLV
jgi:hypothetical protein